MAESRNLGFHRVGLIPAQPPRRLGAYEDWVARGYHGDMAYMARDDHRRGRRDPRELLPGAQTIVVVALAHSPGERAGAGGPVVPADRLRGAVARYARGADYHRVMKEKLRALAERLSRRTGQEIPARACVDTAPILERDAAERAGLGFTAKNTMLIAPGLGSYVLLGELLLGAEARAEPADGAAAHKGCGSCRACLDACPTGAFPTPYVLDARRCISYLTIENRGPIPRALRPLIGSWIFGCDICQQVCPYNAAAPHRSAPAPELEARAAQSHPELIAMLETTGNQYKKWVRGTALERARRPQFLRNVCVALGNAGAKRAAPALDAALADRSSLVRGHAAWALGALGEGARCRLHVDAEADPWVREELELAAR